LHCIQLYWRWRCPEIRTNQDASFQPCW